MSKTKFTVIGTGNRGLGCFAKGLLAFETKGRPEFRDHADLVALVDANVTRAKACAKELKVPDLPVYADIAEAQKQTPADWCIVTTPDFTHQEIVCQALRSGLNVIVDKPLATSVLECDQIIERMNETGKEVVVGHNARYSHQLFVAKKAVAAGEIGEIVSVDAGEFLSLSHGGDYFHRWHSDFSKSAGLMTHKCCHQLDIICWIVDDDPVEVAGFGDRRFYVPRPDLKHGERCMDCEIGKDCPHYFEMDKWDGVYRRIYFEAENDDGYIRDRCVYSDRHTINDYENLVIRFKGGAQANFTLVAFAPREHAYFNFTGTRGRVEAGSTSFDGSPYCRIVRPDGKVEELNVKRDDAEHEHGHGGADIALIADRIGIGTSDPFQKALPFEARRAVAISDMAARSIAAGGRPSRIEETGKDFPPAPPKP